MVALVLLLWIIALILGTVIVRDKGGDVVAAHVVAHGRSQALWRLPGGLFVAIPQMEGTVEIRCRDGSTQQQGYVTSHTNTWLVVDGPGCGRLREL